jgi:hypothetical protein
MFARRDRDSEDGVGGGFCGDADVQRGLPGGAGWGGV